MGFTFASEDAICPIILSFHPQHVRNLKQENYFYDVSKIPQQSESANHYNYVNICLVVIVSVTEIESKPYKNILNDCMKVNMVTIFKKTKDEEYLFFGST